MKFEYSDGGRREAGFKGDAGDCVVRAIAIALDRPYKEVYDDLRDLAGGTPRDGVYRKVYQRYLESKGWRWVAVMKIGAGCKVHLREGEVPGGRIIVRLSRHLAAVIDGVVHDVYDPSRDGTRCVYGYFAPSGTLLD